MDNVALKLIGKAPNERRLALLLVLMSAVLSMFLTNDVALFITVPITLTLQRLLNNHLGKIIVFEAIAANVGSTLTPIGNPQNLFLWHTSQAPFSAFVVEMIPLELVLLGLLIAFTLLSFNNKPLGLDVIDSPATVDEKLLKVSVLCFLIFLVFFNLRIPAYGLLILLPVYLWSGQGVLQRLDWSLIALFILMFIDLRLIAEIPAVTRLFTLIGVDQSKGLFVTSILTSQAISNVPAAILLAEYTHNWPVLAYGVNVAGNGIVIGSLANIIALRLAKDKRIWVTFHIYSTAFLLVSAVLTYAVLFAK